MKYDEVETPLQLLDFMNDHIAYGFKGTDGELYTEDDSEKFKFGEETIWKLSSPSKVLEDGYGICWDQVEFERQWFVEHDLSSKLCSCGSSWIMRILIRLILFSYMKKKINIVFSNMQIAKIGELKSSILIKMPFIIK